MRLPFIRICALVLPALLLIGCPRQKVERMQPLRDEITAFNAKAEHSDPTVKVQHILVGQGAQFGGRSMADAEARAAEVWNRIKAGDDFDALVKEYTDDSHPGIYTMTLKGASNHPALLFKRTEMVPAFGDTGWRLQVGEVGIAGYHPSKSPYGWHFVKRME